MRQAKEGPARKMVGAKGWLAADAMTATRAGFKAASKGDVEEAG